jgi:hypothetical protein
LIKANALPANSWIGIIEMAWEDRTPFEAIEYQFGLMEKDVISLMRQSLKPGSFRSLAQTCLRPARPNMQPQAMPTASEQLAITRQDHTRIQSSDWLLERLAILASAQREKK